MEPTSWGSVHVNVQEQCPVVVQRGSLLARTVTAVVPQIMGTMVMRIKQVPGTLSALHVVPDLVFMTIPHGVGPTTAVQATDRGNWGMGRSKQPSPVCKGHSQGAVLGKHENSAFFSMWLSSPCWPGLPVVSLLSSWSPSGALLPVCPCVLVSTYFIKSVPKKSLGGTGRKKKGRGGVVQGLKEMWQGTRRRL